MATTIQRDTAEELRRLWEIADRRERDLGEELTEVRADKAAYERVIANHPIEGDEAKQAKLQHSHIRPRLLAHCATHEEAFREIANRSGGIVRVSEASRLVHDAGLSRGKVTSINSSMSNRLESHEEWEHVGPGTFRLLTYKGESANEKGDEQWLIELSTTDSGDVSLPLYQGDEGSEVSLGLMTA